MQVLHGERVVTVVGEREIEGRVDRAEVFLGGDLSAGRVEQSQHQRRGRTLPPRDAGEGHRLALLGGKDEVVDVADLVEAAVDALSEIGSVRSFRIVVRFGFEELIAITDGDLTDFPFDEYTGGFTLKASVNGGAKSIAKLDIDKSVHGYKFSATAESVLNNTELEIEFRLSRSPAVMFLVIIGMLSLTLVVLSAVNVAWHVGARGRKVEFSMMVWVAALLFVIPAVRNGMPGSPPPGAMIDFGLFFWLHVLAVIALLTLVSRWSRESK